MLLHSCVIMLALTITSTHTLPLPDVEPMAKSTTTRPIRSRAPKGVVNQVERVFGGGFDAVADAVVGTANIVVHPINTGRATWQAVTHVPETSRAIKDNIVHAFKEDPYHATGYTLGTLAMVGAPLYDAHGQPFTRFGTEAKIAAAAEEGAEYRRLFAENPPVSVDKELQEANEAFDAAKEAKSQHFSFERAGSHEIDQVLDEKEHLKKANTFSLHSGEIKGQKMQEKDRLIREIRAKLKQSELKESVKNMKKELNNLLKSHAGNSEIVLAKKKAIEITEAKIVDMDALDRNIAKSRAILSNVYLRKDVGITKAELDGKAAALIEAEKHIRQRKPGSPVGTNNQVSGSGPASSDTSVSSSNQVDNAGLPDAEGVENQSPNVEQLTNARAVVEGEHISNAGSSDAGSSAPAGEGSLKAAPNVKTEPMAGKSPSSPAGRTWTEWFGSMFNKKPSTSAFPATTPLKHVKLEQTAEFKTAQKAAYDYHKAKEVVAAAEAESQYQEIMAHGSWKEKVAAYLDHHAKGAARYVKQSPSSLIQWMDKRTNFPYIRTAKKSIADRTHKLWEQYKKPFANVNAGFVPAAESNGQLQE